MIKMENWLAITNRCGDLFFEKTKMKVLLIAGARPKLMKIAPIFRGSLKHQQLVCKVVHTGQHYDYEMSQTFFEDLEIR